MYTDTIKTQEEALCHLFLHCCLKDGVFTPEEIDEVSGRFVALGLQAQLNFKDEMIKYRSYKAEIGDEKAYLEYLIHLMPPLNELALYSYCIELVLSDSSFDSEEEQLLNKIADVLKLDETEQLVTKKLLIQRKIIETQKIF